jgi:DNA repair exonuclease SbcCD ATPase subunit
MFKTLRIKNFQSHENTFIEFSPYVTAFIGLNNHGKSAIIKALRKAIRNYPLGDSFIRNIPEPQKECLIEITHSNGNVVERKITKTGENSYKVTLGNTTFDFNKFSRTGIPEEVYAALQISPEISLDNSISVDLNFHTQKDDDFLVRGKGLSSVRTKIISTITGIDLVQKAFSLSKTKERNIEVEIKRLKSQEVDLNKKLEKYKDIDKILEDLDYIGKRFEEIDKNQKRLVFLGEKKRELESIVQKAFYVKNVLQVIQIPSSLVVERKLSYLNKLIYIQKLAERIKKYTSLIGNVNLPTLDNIQKNVKIYFKIMSLYNLKTKVEKLSFYENKYFDIQRLYTTFQEVSSLNNIRTKLLEIRNKTNYLFSDIATKKELLAEFNLQISKEKDNLDKIKKDLKVCPICGRPF